LLVDLVKPRLVGMKKIDIAAIERAQAGGQAA
jgi:hypothetical protein